MKRSAEHDRGMAGMGGRGVARPHIGMNGGMADGMSARDRERMLVDHHRQTLWAYWLLVLLGLWLVAFPLTFPAAAGAVAPSGGREVWLPLGARAAAVSWSDLASGILLLVFGWRSLTPGRPVSRWVCCVTGVWLTFAPLVFWAPSAASYLNDTLVGMLAIALAILIPGMPAMIRHMEMGPETPPGWSYNPSSWPQRAIMIALAFVGLLVSRYLSAYQLGYLPRAWDPFFGEGTRRVLDSAMSESLPISDAALGAVAYTFEFLMGWMGGPARWRTMPWMVTIFGLLVIPLGLTHVFLVASQPATVGAWCTFCLLAAAIMLPMIPIEADEVVAMGQFLAAAKRRGDSLWHAFWFGGRLDGGGPDERSPSVAELPQRAAAVAAASLWGMSVPWTLLVSVVLGIALVFLAGALGAAGAAARALQVGGLLVTAFAVVAMGEVLRLVRYLNLPLGLGIVAAPWVFAGDAGAALRLAAAAVGLLVAALALPRGPKTESYGGWDRFVR